MAEIFLIKNNSDGSELFRFKITNYASISITPDWPITPAPLPEEGSDQNVLVKLSGNILVCGVSWILKDYDTNQEITAGITTKTVQQQINFFNNLFQAQSIEDSFRLVINYPTDPIFFDGFFTGVKFNTTQPGVLTWTARATFLQGKVISIYNLDTPTAPLNVVLSSPASDEIQVDWTTPVDSGTNPITGYRVQYAIQGGNFVDVDLGVVLTHTITSLAAGTYTVRVLARSSLGLGSRSVEKNITIP